MKSCGRAAAARTSSGDRGQPGGGPVEEPAWTAARRDEAEARAEHPCHAGDQSRQPPKARRAETGLAAAAGHGMPQPPHWTAAQRASRALRSLAAGSPSPGRGGGLPITTQLPHARPAACGARPVVVARRRRAAELHRGPPARDAAPPLLLRIAKTPRAGDGRYGARVYLAQWERWACAVSGPGRVEAAETRRPEPPRLDR